MKPLKRLLHLLGSRSAPVALPSPGGYLGDSLARDAVLQGWCHYHAELTGTGMVNCSNVALLIGCCAQAWGHTASSLLPESESVVSLVGLARDGSDDQKTYAARALAILAVNAESQVAIAQAGGIKPLVGLARDGSDDQKTRAALALGSLAVSAENQMAIAQAGGIKPLVALARDGSDDQKTHAALALAILAESAENHMAIAQAGGIKPL
eukprot:5047520-Prymnesium_polylepis.1